MAAVASPYPVRLEADYPERLSRLATFFRIVLVIPLLLFAALISGGGGFSAFDGDGLTERGAQVSVGALGSLVLAHLIAVVLRGRPVAWLFDVIVAIQRFVLRAASYLLLLTDRYPPFEGEWSVRYEVERPERLRRWQVLIWKTALSIPHLIILAILLIGVVVVVVIAWFAILVSGRYPEGLFGFVSGWLRWGARVGAYWYSLTDEFPPFSFSADAGTASGSTYVISAVLGWMIGLAWVVAIGALAAWPGQAKEVTVSYQGLLQGTPSPAVTVFDVEVQALGAADPYEFADGLYRPKENRRFVLFVIGLDNRSEGRARVEREDFRLEDSRGQEYGPFLVTAGGLKPPRSLKEGQQGEVYVLFEVRDGGEPVKLEYRPSFGFKQRVEFRFE